MTYSGSRSAGHHLLVGCTLLFAMTYSDVVDFDMMGMLDVPSILP